MRWPEGPPHLALNPPYICLFVYLFICFCFVFVLFCFCFVFVFFVFVLVFFGGFKGQVRWPEGPPHLALNPPYFSGVYLFWFSCFCLVSFPFFALIEKHGFPLKGHFLFIFECLPFFLHSLFLHPPFSLLLSLSLSLYFYFLSSFLLVIIFCFLLVSCFCLFLSFGFFFAFVS